MTARRGAATLALILVLGGCTTTSTGSRRLTVRAPGWLLAGFDARLEVSTSGALTNYDVILNVSIGKRILGRFPTSEGRATISIPSEELSEGPNILSVKTGGERSELVVHVVPFGYVWAPAGAVAGLLAAVAARRRRRARFNR